MHVRIMSSGSLLHLCCLFGRAVQNLPGCSSRRSNLPGVTGNLGVRKGPAAAGVNAEQLGSDCWRTFMTLVLLALSQVQYTIHTRLLLQEYIADSIHHSCDHITSCLLSAILSEIGLSAGSSRKMRIARSPSSAMGFSRPLLPAPSQSISRNQRNTS